MIFRRNWLIAALTIIPLLVVSGIMAYYSFWNIYKEFSNNKPNWSLVLLCLIGIYGVFILLSIVYSYLKKTPSIVLHKSSIRFGNGNEIPFSEIANITYTGKQSVSFFLTGEGMKIELADKTVRVALDECYKDLWKLKLSLYQTFTLKKEPEEFVIKPVSIEEYQDEPQTIFKGFVLFSMFGLLSYFLTFLFLIALIFELKRGENIALILITLYGAFMISVFSNGLHYFILTNNFLIVKNHHFFWKTHVYRLTDIKKISFEQRGKSPNFMRIITNDFKMKTYQADSLGKKQWRGLKEFFEEREIKVDDCLFY
jgi:hypothetical protein